MVCIVDEGFCASYPVDLVIKHKCGLFSKTHYKVRDSNKALIFRVKGSLLGVLHQRRILYDSAGSPILTMRAKVFTLHQRWRAYRGDSYKKRDLLFSVKTTKYWQGSKSLDVFLAANTRENKRDFHVKCKHSKTWCTIFRGNSIIAEVKDRSSIGQSALGKDVLVITVYPGVDRAFITTLVVILYKIKVTESSTPSPVEAGVEAAVAVITA